MSTFFLIELAGMMALLFCSAFFSSAETALFSLSTLQIHRLRRSHPAQAAALETLLATPRRLLSTILIGNTLVNVATATLGYSVVSHWTSYSVAASIPFVTILLILFGEIAPKRFAIYHAERLSLLYSPALRVLVTLLTQIGRAHV